MTRAQEHYDFIVFLITMWSLLVLATPAMIRGMCNKNKSRGIGDGNFCTKHTINYRGNLRPLYGPHRHPYTPGCDGPRHSRTIF